MKTTADRQPRRRWRRSTYVPLMMLAYLAVMAWIGRGELLAGRYAYYFGIIAATLICIFLLRRHLLRRERSAGSSPRK